MTHAGKFEDDPRTPQELAKAILDHEFTARSNRAPGFSFREQLFHDHLSEYEQPDAYAFLHALKCVEDDIPLETREDKRSLERGLQVIAGYEKESRGLAGGTVNLSPELRELQDRMEAGDKLGDLAAEINNLKQIAKLLRVLAKKMNLRLLDPGRPGLG